MRYKIGQVNVDLKTGIALKNGEKISIRAKTLQVLKYLIKHNERIVTKDELLNSIWHDVVVQEQVLVQSIKEIRSIFSSETVKTYPKKGYQWVAPFDILTNPIPKNFAVIISSALIFIFCLFTYWYFHSTNKPEKLKIAFLPIENAIPDAAHLWLPSQGTENLRRLMAEQSQVVALTAEQIDEIKLEQQVDVIVSTTLLGYPNDYQLDYSLYLPHGSERGVEFSSTIDGAFEKLVQKLIDRFELNSAIDKQAITESDFSEEALTRGIALFLTREYQSALGFFSAALHENHELLVARRFLAASMINTQQIDPAINVLLENIELAKSLADHKEQIRSQLMLGALYLNLPNGGQLDDAKRHLNKVISLAEAKKNSIFAAYGYEELAKIHRLQGQYQFAIQLLKKALVYHQHVEDNYSKTTALIELALANAQLGNKVVSDQYFQQAQTIADDHGATTNKVAILLARAQLVKTHDNIKQANIYAKHALALATNANNDLLVARINAWLENKYFYEVH